MACCVSHPNVIHWRRYLGIWVFVCLIFIIFLYVQNDSFPLTSGLWKIKLSHSDFDSVGDIELPELNSAVKSKVLTTGQALRKNKLYIMIKTTNMHGRLGNQMFIYASLLGIAFIQNRTPALENGLPVADSFKLSFINNDISTVGWRHVKENYNSKFEPALMKLPEQNLTLSGYFQSWKYFGHISDQIRNEFKFYGSVRHKTTTFYTNLRNSYPNTTFIGVHVRRGDTLKIKRSKAVYGTPQRTYFGKAFSYFRNMFLNQTRFLIASDDIKWCQENLRDIDVEMLSPDSPVQHMSILSQSDHFVLSIGTFGWWCAWLCEGTTIYYKREFDSSSIHSILPPKQDFYLPEWIGMSN